MGSGIFRGNPPCPDNSRSKNNSTPLLVFLFFFFKFFKLFFVFLNPSTKNQGIKNLRNKPGEKNPKSIPDFLIFSFYSLGTELTRNPYFFFFFLGSFLNPKKILFVFLRDGLGISRSSSRIPLGKAGIFGGTGMVAHGKGREGRERRLREGKEIGIFPAEIPNSKGKINPRRSVVSSTFPIPERFRTAGSAHVEKRMEVGILLG